MADPASCCTRAGSYCARVYALFNHDGVHVVDVGCVDETASIRRRTWDAHGRPGAGRAQPDAAEPGTDRCPDRRRPAGPVALTGPVSRLSTAREQVVGGKAGTATLNQ